MILSLDLRRFGIKTNFMRFTFLAHKPILEMSCGMRQSDIAKLQLRLVSVYELRSYWGGIMS